MNILHVIFMLKVQPSLSEFKFPFYQVKTSLIAPHCKTHYKNIIASNSTVSLHYLAHFKNVLNKNSCQILQIAPAVMAVLVTWNS